VLLHPAQLRQRHPDLAHIALGLALAQILQQGGGQRLFMALDKVLQPSQRADAILNGAGRAGIEEVVLPVQKLLYFQPRS
jgi:uncharacterized membrane protein YhfC